MSEFPPSTPATAEPIVVIAQSSRVLELLRLAVLRSDSVMAVMIDPDSATRRFADAFAVEIHTRAPQPSDLEGASAALVALADVGAENEIVRAARRRGVPIYVSGRSLVSDFTPLAFMEQRPLSSLAA